MVESTAMPGGMEEEKERGEDEKEERGEKVGKEE